MGNDVKIHQDELDKILQDIAKDRMEWTEDLRSKIQDKAPQGVTGQLASTETWPVVHTDTENEKYQVLKPGVVEVEYGE